MLNGARNRGGGRRIKAIAISTHNTLNSALLFSGGVPYDGAAQERIHPNSIVLVSIYSVAAFAGIVYAIACLLFNIIFRNRKYAYNCNISYT